MVRRSLRLLLAVSFVAGCGGSSEDPPGPLSTTRSTVAVSPASVTADGVATATVTVRALDDSDRPLAGRAVTIAVSGTGNALGSATATTAGDGSATTTLSSTRAETKQVTVTVDGVALPDASVEFVAGPAARLAFSAEPADVEAGGTLSTARVAVMDAHGNTVAGSSAPVDLALAGGTAGASLAGTTSVAAASGEAAFADLSIARAGTGYTLVASSAGLDGATSAAFDVTPAAPSLAGSAVEVVPAQAVADGTAIAVRVAVKDAFGNGVPGVAVALDAGGSDNTLTQPAAPTDADGVATGALSSFRAEAKSVSAWIGGVPLPQTATATFLAGPAAGLVVLSAPASGVAGETLAEVRVAVVDAHQNPAAAPGPVTLALAGGPAATLLGTLAAEAVASVAGFGDLSLRVAGAGYVLRATSGALEIDTAPFAIAPAAAATSSVASSRSPVADGVDSTTLTATVLDAFGNAVPGVAVTLVATGSANAIVQPGPTGANGTCSGALASTKAEEKSVTATAAGVTAAPTAVTFVAGPAASLLVLAAPTSGVAGETLAQVRIGVVDAQGNAAAAPGPVTLALAGGPAATLLGTSTAEAAASVATFADLSLHVAGTGYVLRATSGALEADTAPFAVAPARPATSSVASSRSPVADGVDTTTLTATIRDAYGNPVPAVVVSFAATGTANTIVQPSAPTGADGTCSGTLASTKAEEKSVTAVAAGGVTQTATTVTFVPGAPDPAQSDFTAAPVTVPADGTTPVALAAVVRDAFGNAVPGVTVAFASSRPADVLVQPAVTDASGQASGSGTSAVAGASTLSGTMDGAAFAATRTVRFEGAFVATSPAKALAVAGKVCGTTGYANTGHRLSIDRIGTVYLASNCGGEGFVAASVDGARTFGTPVSTGMTGLTQIAVQGGPDGVAYVAGTTSGGGTLFGRTTDQGATWEAPVPLATSGAYSDRAASVAAYGDGVFVQPTYPSTSVYRNGSRGAGAFASTALPTNTSGVFWGLLADSSGTLWSCLDNATLYVSRSADGGATFAPWSAVGGAVGYSSWAIGGDVIWVAGSGAAYNIPVSATPTSTAVGGLVYSGAYLETAVAVDAAGTGYVAQGDGTGIRMQRARRSDASFGTIEAVDAAGHNPAIAAPAGTNKVIVAYEKSGEVWVTVRTY